MVAFVCALMALMAQGQSPTQAAGVPTVSISGEGMRAGQVVLTDGLTVGDLVERAGGFRAPHVSYDVTIIRRSSSPEIAGPAALPFQCVATLKTTLRNGDVILINRPGPTSKESGLMKRITCDRGREPK